MNLGGSSDPAPTWARSGGNLRQVPTFLANSFPRTLIRLSLLGPIHCEDADGGTMGSLIAQPKRLALVIYLAAATPSGFQRRDTLLALFWPELDTARARDALSSALSFLRRTLGTSVLITQGMEEIGIDRAALWCDVAAFRELIAQSRFGEALDLYRGAFLDGFYARDSEGFSQWADEERERLRTSATRAARALAESRESDEHYTTAVAAARRAVDLSNEGDERAFRDLLELLDRLGDRAGALAAFDRFAKRLASSLEVEPSAETLAVVEAIRSRTLSHAQPSVDTSHEAARWELEREIGRGGSAIVYLARDVKHGRKVALKKMRAEEVSPEGTVRFLREIEITAQLSHPHILPLLDSGGTHDGLYLVTPYVPGESLRARLAREKQLPIPDALRIAAEIADALDYAHRSGIIHRDIKPANILLADGHAIVADFGIARALRAAGAELLSEDSVVLGTRQYMSPEQRTASGTVGARTDIYALGFVLYEMLAGELPEQGDIATGLRRLRPEVTPAIASLVAMCLEEDPDRRPARAADVTHALRITLPQRRLRRSRVLVTTMAALLACTIGIAALFRRDWEAPALFGAARLGPADRVIIADFSANASDSGVASILGEAVRAAMEQSRTVPLVPVREIAAALSEMRRDRGAPLSSETAREVAQRIGARAVLVGRVARTDSNYIVSLELNATATGDRIASVQGVAAGLTSLLTTLDDLTARMRRKMGASLRDVRGAVPLARATTSSLAALSRYSDAVKANDAEVNYPRAEQLLVEAVGIDSTFALAWRKLAMVRLNAGYPRYLVDSALERAAHYAERLPDRERHLAMGAFYRLHTRLGNPLLARREYRIAIDVDSVVQPAANQLKNLYAEKLDFDSAYYFATLDPAPAYAARFAAFAGRTARAVAILDSLRVASPRVLSTLGYLEARYVLAHASLQRDSLLAIARALAQLGSVPARAVADSILVEEALMHGELRTARRYQLAIDSLAARQGTGGLGVHRAIGDAMIDSWYRGRAADATRRLSDIAQGPDFAALAPGDRPNLELAVAYARANAAGRAQESLRRAERDQPWLLRPPPTTAYRLRAQAEVALVRRDFRHALALFRQSAGADSIGEQCDACATFGIARTFDMMGQRDSAITSFEHYLAIPGARRGVFHTSIDAEALPFLLRRLAELHDERGDRDKAVAYYARFISLWERADPELQPVVRAARERLSTLTRSARVVRVSLRPRAGR